MLNLLLLLPVLLLFLAALGIVILQQVRPSIGYAWLIAVLAGLAATVALLVLRWRIPLEVSAEWWRPFADLSTPPTLRLDERSWPYAFCLGLLALAFALTEAARLEREARPYNWAVGLALTGIGLLAVMAATPMTLVLAWTAVDGAEFLMLMTNSASRRMAPQTVTLFSVRVFGTLLVILAILLSRAQAIDFSLTSIPPQMAVIMLLASGLRLGVLPLNIPYIREVYIWRGLGSVMRMIGPASSMVVLGYMPESAVPSEWKGVFLFFSVLSALYGGAMWFSAADEIQGRPYWFIALSALGVASVVNGHAQASIAWGMALILSGSLLFFYTARRRTILFIPLLGMLGITGLPYTPAAAGWPGVAGASSGVYGVLFVISALLLVWGYLRHIFSPQRDELYPMERWVHTVYPAGLLFLVLGHWTVAVLGWPGSLSVGVLQASLPLAFIASLGAVLVITFRSSWFPAAETAAVQSLSVEGEPAGDESVPVLEPSAALESYPLEVKTPPSSPVRTRGLESFQAMRASQRWLNHFAHRVGGILAAFFRLNWMYRFIAWVYTVVQTIVHLLTAMFEGDGGILWSLVMLALLISMVLPGARP